MNDISTANVVSFSYTWDANKRKLTQTETGIPLDNQNYSYDSEDRLTGFNRQNGDSQAWTLSLVGDWNQFNKNGTVENRTHNAVHETTSVDAIPLTYDLKGNTTQNSNGQVYSWDIENRLTLATDGFNTLGSYTYDALGRRASKTVNGNTTVFVSSGMQEICEYENNVLARSYVFGSYIDEPLMMITGNNKFYYHANNLYSVSALTDQNGIVVERYKYNPYGKVTILGADGVTVRTVSIVGNPWTFTGRRLDVETGLMYFRNRTWDVNLGQFISRDPFEYIDGTSLYRGYFVPNSLDPLGLWFGWDDLAGAVVGGVVGGVSAWVTGGDVYGGIVGGAVSGVLIVNGVPPNIAGAVGGAVSGLISGVRTATKNETICKASFSMKVAYVSMSTFVSAGGGWIGAGLGDKLSGAVGGELINKSLLTVTSTFEVTTKSLVIKGSMGFTSTATKKYLFDAPINAFGAAGRLIENSNNQKTEINIDVKERKLPCPTCEGTGE